MRRIIDSNGEVHQIYSDYLKSKHWNMMKHNARIEYGYTCSRCNKDGIVLHLHHKTYKRVGRENIADLMFLCKDCHSAVHARLDKIKENRKNGRKKAKATIAKKKAKKKKNKGKTYYANVPVKKKNSYNNRKPKNGKNGSFPIDYV